MKKLESLKSSTLKSNIIAENKLRNISGGETCVNNRSDAVSSSGTTYFEGGTVVKFDNVKSQE